MERSQRQSDNVYRFIKQFADTPRKPAPAPVPNPVRRPEPQTPAAPASTLSVQPEVRPTAPVSVANTESLAPVQASSAAPPAATPQATATAAAQEPVAEDEEELQLVEQVQPEFPRGLQTTTDNGKVIVAFTVQPNGTVSEASVVTASHRRFGKPARDAVAQWRFAPIKAARAAQVEIAFKMQ